MGNWGQETAFRKKNANILNISYGYSKSQVAAKAFNAAIDDTWRDSLTQYPKLVRVVVIPGL